MSIRKMIMAVVPVVAGVLLAGFLMGQFRDVEIIGKAHAGFDS